MALGPGARVSGLALWALLRIARGAALDLAEWTTSRWYVQVDGVMGGRSSGRMELAASGASFEGSINLNGGGFASFRRNFGATDLRPYAGLWVEVDTLPVTALTPLAVHVQLEDQSRYNGFGAAFAIPPGPPGSTYSTFLPFSWFTKQLRWACSGCSLDVSRITGLSVYVLYQEGAYSFRVRKILALPSQEVPAQEMVPTLILSNEEAWKRITAAIKKGSFVWNQGYRALCGAIYNSTALTVAAATNVTASAQSIAQAASLMAEPYPVNKGGDAAWIFRRGFDQILAAYEGSTPRDETSYPSVARGDWVEAASQGKDVRLLPVSQLEADLQQQSGTGALSGSLLWLLMLGGAMCGF
mmetsp:Transcript_3957/g.9190  ORF Transcript_3957/g.9190 Transcript_3957/m.9190 type:complete len:356 (+) Transcript_3957:65-1132(+)